LKALPVVDDDGRLVGIVSQADLLKSFVREDASIRREIMEDVLRGTLSIDPKIPSSPRGHGSRGTQRVEPAA
jgi:CBS-domain-containing membrane protein